MAQVLDHSDALDRACLEKHRVRGNGWVLYPQQEVANFRMQVLLHSHSINMTSYRFQ